MSKLSGEPLSFGRDLDCLGDRILKAQVSGRMEDLGHPEAENSCNSTIIKLGGSSLFYVCGGECCIDVLTSDDRRVPAYRCVLSMTRLPGEDSYELGERPAWDILEIPFCGKRLDETAPGQ